MRQDRSNPKIYHGNYVILSRLRDELLAIAEKMHSYFEGDKKNITLLDYGCGFQPYRDLFKKYVNSYIGVDIAENKAADYVISKDDMTVPMDDKSVDVVFSTQVLEHVADPSVYLRESRRLVADGGLLVLSTHGYWREHPDPVDYWRWTSEGLVKTIEDCGWEVKELHGVLGFSAAAMQLFQSSIDYKIPKILKKVFFLVMQGLIAFLDSCYSAEGRKRNASVFIIVAKAK